MSRFFFYFSVNACSWTRTHTYPHTCVCDSCLCGRTRTDGQNSYLCFKKWYDHDWEWLLRDKYKGFLWLCTFYMPFFVLPNQLSYRNTVCLCHEISPIDIMWHTKHQWSPPRINYSRLLLTAPMFFSSSDQTNKTENKSKRSLSECQYCPNHEWLLSLGLPLALVYVFVCIQSQGLSRK